MPSPELTREEAGRVLRLCAACMYCDGLCPVFPALSGKHEHSLADMSYLANVCHNCRACWHACQFAPPHPFAVNVSATLAALRQDSYADHVWPRALDRGFRHPALAAGIFVAVALAVVLIVLAPHSSWVALHGARLGPGSFYAVAPLGLMIGLAGASAGWAVLSLAISTLRFWRAISLEMEPRVRLGALWLAAAEIVTLRYLDGGGVGCNDSGPQFSQRRRIFHQIMVAGFVLLFAATLAAAFFQHVLGVMPPFARTSLPVAFGVAGGLAVLAGAGGLLAIQASSDREPSQRGETLLNLTFLGLIKLTALSGLALLVWRDTAAMGLLLALHLGLVMGFFVALPASKALHAPFRAAAILRSAAERLSRGRRQARNDATFE